MRPTNSNQRHKTIDEQIAEFFSSGGEVEKVEKGKSAMTNGLTKSAVSDSQKRKGKTIIPCDVQR